MEIKQSSLQIPKYTGVIKQACLYTVQGWSVVHADILSNRYMLTCCVISCSYMHVHTGSMLITVVYMYKEGEVGLSLYTCVHC